MLSNERSAFIFNSFTDLMNVVTKMNKQESELSLWQLALAILLIMHEF